MLAILDLRFLIAVLGFVFGFGQNRSLQDLAGLFIIYFLVTFDLAVQLRFLNPPSHLLALIVELRDPRIFTS